MVTPDIDEDKQIANELTPFTEKKSSTSESLSHFFSGSF